ncbi:CU044_5270 family protein [Streptomyces sp. NPDC015492]|uniref:CU044_5270 family protein n=1 Tax=Streptomyces sp. NPDC015492 TaxID=3364958 RepID=UPI0037020E35
MNRDLDDDLQALRRMLPAPAERDFPAGRRHQREDHLMTSWQKMNSTSTHGRTRRSRRLTLIAVPTAMGALAAAYGMGVLPGLGQAPEHTPAPPAIAQAGTGSTGGAVQLLDRIATVAAAKPAPTVRDDQYTYVESLTASLVTIADGPNPRSFLEKPHMRQIWYSADGSRPGRLDQKGESDELPPAGSGYLNGPTYRYLESLPTDPDALLRKIYADTQGAGPSPDEEAFITIGDALREQVAPPQVSAALYKAAAKIPGVSVVPDAVDAAGRQGIGVAFLRSSGERTEWIFNKKTLDFLGERSVMAKDTDWAKKGQVTSSAAVLRSGIVDKPGQHPGTHAS